MPMEQQGGLSNAIESFGLSDGEKTILTNALKFMLGKTLTPTDLNLSLPEVKKVVDDHDLSDEEKQKKICTVLLHYLTKNIKDIEESDQTSLGTILSKRTIIKMLEGQKLDGNNQIGAEIDEKQISEMNTKVEKLWNKLQSIEKQLNQALNTEKIDRLQEELEAIKYDILPTSPMLYLFNSAITNNGKRKQIRTTRNGTKQSDRHKNILYTKTNDNGYKITQTNKKTGEQLEITLTNADRIQGKGIKKCFALLLTISNKQHFSPVIGFPLQELVDRGMYSTLSNARVGLKKALDVLQNIKFSGTIKKGKKREIKQTEGGVLYYHYKIKNNYVEVSVNDNFNIEFIASYYALMPQFAYSLNNSNSFDLCEYIFMQARQNTLEIKETGKFNIGFKKICEILALPHEEEITKKGGKWKPKQYIINPILEAIEELSEKAEKAKTVEFTIKTIYNNNYQNLGEFLEGYITVKFTNEIYQKLVEITQRQEEKKYLFST